MGALGLADDGTKTLSVSSSTLDNARRGRPIPHRWSNVADGVLELLATNGAPLLSPERVRDLRGPFRALLRRWDEGLGEMPPPEHLSLQHQLHPLLVLLAPQVGMRLGALTVFCAETTATSVDEWRWVTAPFDERFFGRVVRALFDFRCRDLVTEDQCRDALAEAEAVEWRTVQRWIAGDIAVPSTKRFARMDKVLGPHTEQILRLARVAAYARVSLSRWLGPKLLEEWSALVAMYATSAQSALGNPEVIALLLRIFADELEHGVTHQLLRACLPAGAQECGERELATRLRFQAEVHLSNGTSQSPLARAAKLRIVVQLHERFQEMLGNVFAHAGDLGNWPWLIGQFWRSKTITARFAAGLPIKFGEREIQPTESRQAAAKLLLDSNLTFEPSAIADRFSPRNVALMAAAFGRAEIEGMFDLPIGQIVALENPDAERDLADEFVLTNRALCLRRARRFAEAGDSIEAGRWLKRAPKPSEQSLRSEKEDMLAVVAEISHSLLDTFRPARDAVRRYAQDRELVASVRSELGQWLPDLDQNVAFMNSVGAAKASLERTVTLVASIPVAVRLAYLRRDLFGHELGLDTIGAHVGELLDCLRAHPRYGKAWAVLAVWHRLSDDKSARSAETNATHNGAEQFFAKQWERISRDLSPDGELNALLAQQP